MWKRKAFSVFLVALFVFSSFTVANAAEGEGAWTELLETATVNNSGSNWFKYNGTATVSVPTPYSMRLSKVDMLITYPANTAPTKVEVLYSSKSYELTMRRIDECTSRVFGTIAQNFYSDVRVRFTRGGTSAAYLEILSFRVSQIIHSEQAAQAQVVIDNNYFTTNYFIEVPGDGLKETAYKTIRIDVEDWMKYDVISVWGSARTMALTSVRANLSTLGLPFEMNYIQIVPTGEDTSYTERFTYYENSSTSGGYGNIYGDAQTAMEYGGQILFCITIDLSNVDRTFTENPLHVYLTGVYFDLYGFTFNCQYVNGSIFVPDKSEIGWWTRFTSFMEGLFGGDTSQSDLFQQEAQDQANEFDELNSQVENFTRPDLEDMDFSIESYVSDQEIAEAAQPLGELVSDPFILVPVALSLTVALVAYVLYGKR